MFISLRHLRAYNSPPPLFSQLTRVFWPVLPLHGLYGIMIIILIWACLLAFKTLLRVQLLGLGLVISQRLIVDDDVKSPKSVLYKANFCHANLGSNCTFQHSRRSRASFPIWGSKVQDVWWKNCVLISSNEDFLFWFTGTSVCSPPALQQSKKYNSQKKR